MIIQEFNVEIYWKVIVYYNIDYDFFNYIINDISQRTQRTPPVEEVSDAFVKLFNNEAKAVTISDLNNKYSIILFKKHKYKYDYVDSIVHEAEHIKQAMLEVYNVEDKGEPPAYTIGFLVGKMYKTYNKFLCNC